MMKIKPLTYLIVDDFLTKIGINLMLIRRDDERWSIFEGDSILNKEDWFEIEPPLFLRTQERKDKTRFLCESDALRHIQHRLAGMTTLSEFYSGRVKGQK